MSYSTACRTYEKNVKKIIELIENQLKSTSYLDILHSDREHHLKPSTIASNIAKEREDLTILMEAARKWKYSYDIVREEELIHIPQMKKLKLLKKNKMKE